MLYGELLINNGWMIFTMASGISLLSPRPVRFTDIRYAIAVHRGAAGQGPGPPSSCQDHPWDRYKSEEITIRAMGPYR